MTAGIDLPLAQLPFEDVTAAQDERHDNRRGFKSFGPENIIGPGRRLSSRPLENQFFAQSSGQRVAHLRDPQNSETTLPRRDISSGRIRLLMRCLCAKRRTPIDPLCRRS
jgi:hypothetical protein